MCVVREKLRRKDAYIVAAVGLLILILVGSGVGNVSGFDGPLTNYSQLAPAVYLILVVTACAVSVAISLSTIPNEYKRSTSHLVWVRGVSQANYHGQLALGNLIVSGIIYLMLHLGVLAFMAMKGGMGDLPHLLLAIPIGFLPVAIVCVLTSGLSIKVGTMATGLIAVVVIIVGALSVVLIMFAGMLGSPTGTIARTIVNIVPNVYGMAEQAANALKGEALKPNVELAGLLALWVVAQLLWVLRKKEA
jgi:hypothetical protein